MNDRGHNPEDHRSELERQQGLGHGHHDDHGADAAMKALAKSVAALAHEVKALALVCTPRPQLGGFIAAIHGRRTSTMPTVNIPVPKLIDTEEIDLSIMPRKPDGSVDVNVTPNWKGLDPAVTVTPGYYKLDSATGQYVLTTEPFVFKDPLNGDVEVTVPGTYCCVAPTPGASGSYSVDCTAPGFDTNNFGPIVWDTGQPRQLNGSVGTPRAEYSANLASRARRPAGGNAAN